MEEKTKLGLTQNVEAMCAYALIFVSGFILLIIEKDNKFVRFHAMQSFATFLLLGAVSFIGGIIPILGGIIQWAVSVITTGLWIFLMYKAYKGEKYKLPIIGDIVEKQLNN